MQWIRHLLPRRLQPKKLVVLLAVLGIALILVAALQLWELNRSQLSTATDVPEAGLKKSPDFTGLFRRDSDEEEGEDGFEHLERKWKEPEWQVADILRLLPTMKKPVVPVIVVEEHYEGRLVFVDICMYACLHCIVVISMPNN